MQEIISKINKLYGLNAKFFEKVEKGYLSENHILIDENKKYFLKKYRFDSEEKIKEIHSAKKFFAEAGIPVILPFLNKKNRTFFLFNKKYFAIFPFVEGRHIERKDLSDTAIISLGEMLAKIHLVGKGATLPIKEHLEKWNKESLLLKNKDLKEMIEKKDKIDNFDEIALEDLKVRKSLIESNRVRLEDMNLKNDHLIHGDYYKENVFFDDFDKVSSVFDFERVGYAPRVLELFRSLIVIFDYYTFDDEYINKKKLYMKSYLSVYPAPLEELKAGLKLYYLKTLHEFWIEDQHYLKNDDRADKLLPIYLRRLKFFSEHYKEIENNLLDGIQD